jgi:hypothetical protein
MVENGEGVFQFWGCTDLRESLGLRADNVRHLLERLETVPLESIYYHTVRCLLRRRAYPKAYPDDFSAWLSTEARDETLAERLAFHSPFDFPDTESFRQHLLETIEDHLAQQPAYSAMVVGKPFYFLRGHLVSVPLAIFASDLPSFREGLTRVDESALYYHAVEGMWRLGDPRGDFAAWVQDAVDAPSLARSIAEIDPFVMSLAGFRSRLLHLVDAEIERGAAL